MMKDLESMTPLPPLKLKKELTFNKKYHGPDHLIGECYINFEKLMENVLNINESNEHA